MLAMEPCHVKKTSNSKAASDIPESKRKFLLQVTRSAEGGWVKWGKLVNKQCSCTLVHR